MILTILQETATPLQATNAMVPLFVLSQSKVASVYLSFITTRISALRKQIAKEYHVDDNAIKLFHRDTELSDESTFEFGEHFRVDVYLNV